MKRIKPPYAHVIWLAKALDIFGKVKLRKIDKEDIRNYGITSPGNESKIISTLKFLGIINEKNEVNLPRYNAFSYSGDKRKEEISKIVRESYKEIFDDIPNIEEVDYDTLRNYFISKFGFSGILADSSVKAFIFLCEQAGINLSDELKKKKIPSEKKSRVLKKEHSSYKKQRKMEEHLGISEYDRVILLTKGSIRTEFPINSLEDWEDAKESLNKKINRMFNDQGPSAPEENSESPPS